MKTYSILLIVFSVLLIIVLVAGGLHLLNNKSAFTQKSDDCASGPGYEAVKKYITSQPRGVVTIPSGAFQGIVEACGGDKDRAMLCIANYIAYEGVELSGDPPGRKPRSSPPPAAQHTVMSGYPVGACVLGCSGTVYLGANFEFCSPLINTIHGEQCATHNAAVHGEKSITKLAVNAAPCGVCRQFLVEVGSPKDLDVIFCSNEGKFVSKQLSDLLPSSFGPENLGNRNTALKHPVHETLKINQGDSKAIKLAKQMFSQAYAPYTHITEGVVLEFSTGELIPGQTVENAAYNPSVSAFRGACSLAALSGLDMKNLKTVTYVFPSETEQKPGATCTLQDTLENMKAVMEGLYQSQTFASDVQLQSVPIPLPQQNPHALIFLAAQKENNNRPMRLPL